ncbi:BF3164 family lipoprotein [Odoribacter splanchnicus]|jgi:lipoprotein|uniref:BF3164 family lipoprotein n=1 Tax=Odoribacter splanchnicus TaxID=28118 RepID=A0AAW6FMV4_9BACT|nr:BF3164 family lipoprotein [Odoribacter splanchnicus]MDB9205779.1 BF3164 family lipoprotein [Odoribacter splanchnicus]MDB9213308.1 BF3164 family lipoprotein [Odoribacter splanchnicus]MDB9224805.1 BF3164 family lipoprotein [Odoribacter splanchnicus]
MKKALALFLGVISFLACQKSKTEVSYTVPKFSESIKRTVTVLRDTIEDFSPNTIILDSFLIMKHESVRNEQLFHVYNRYSGAYRLSFGNRGRGYGELIHVNGISMDYETKSMYVGSLNQSRITIFQLDSLPWGKVNIAEKRLRQPLSSTTFFRLDPDHYLTTYNAYSRFALYDKNLNLIDSCTHYSPITTQITPEKVLENYYFYCSAVLIKPDGTKFLNFTHCGAILEFFNIQQNKITHSNTSYIYEPTYKADGFPLWQESIRGWRTVYATDNYIYIALNGTKDLETRIEKLSVFDWQGSPVRQYDLGVNIMRVVVDESSKTGYVIYRDDEYEYHLGNFDL